MPRKEQAPALDILTIEEFDAIDDRPEFPVLMPEWGNKNVIVQQPDAETAVMLQESCAGKDGQLDKLKFACRLIYKCCKQPKFTPAHLDKLATRNAKAILRLASAIEHGGKKKEP